MAPSGIKRMKLYQHVDRVERALESRGLAPPVALKPTDIEDLDHLHYEGRDAVDRATGVLGLQVGAQVLDVGSGLGGPARRLATEPGCRVTALELQPDLHACAAELTRRCGLADRIEHVRGDILGEGPIGKSGRSVFDALVSWLVFLHIPDRPALLRRCRQLLRGGGGLYAEDFYIRASLTDEERTLLRDEVQCVHLVDRPNYVDELAAAGFTAVVFEDRTASWRDFVVSRAAAFERTRIEFTALHGAAACEALQSFYETMVTLFSGGRLGGVCVHARAA